MKRRCGRLFRNDVRMSRRVVRVPRLESIVKLFLS